MLTPKKRVPITTIDAMFTLFIRGVVLFIGYHLTDFHNRQLNIAAFIFSARRRLRKSASVLDLVVI
jgi:hypothetical protein